MVRSDTTWRSNQVPVDRAPPEVVGPGASVIETCTGSIVATARSGSRTGPASRWPSR